MQEEPLFLLTASLDYGGYLPQVIFRVKKTCGLKLGPYLLGKDDRKLGNKTR